MAVGESRKNREFSATARPQVFKMQSMKHRPLYPGWLPAPPGNWQLAIGNWPSGLLAFALLAVLLFPGTASAADLFPRGPGFYFHPLKLFVLLLVYICWVRTCWWVDQDAK